MIGGNNQFKLGDTWEYFDIDSNKWNIIEPVLPFDYFNHWILSIENDKILIVGGFTANSVNQNIHEIDLKEKTIINKARMKIKRQGFNMFYLTKENKICIIGDDKGFNSVGAFFH